MSEDGGKMSFPLTQFGGRMGKDEEGNDINDDGISHRVEGGLSIEIMHEKTGAGTHFIKIKNRLINENNMFEKLTNDNITMFAIKHYDNPQCEGETEFQDDMKHFKYVKRLLRKYKETERTKRTSDTKSSDCHL